MLTVGPLIEGAAYEIQFATPPKVTMLDGYLTVDTGAWHFHLCVNDHRGTRSAELARIRRVARAAFFKTEGGSCAPATWGLRLWNGRGEQMVTILFPNPSLRREVAAPPGASLGEDGALAGAPTAIRGRLTSCAAAAWSLGAACAAL